LTIKNLENDLNVNFLIFLFFFGEISPIESKLFLATQKNPTFLDIGGKNEPKAF
jgi:hypothetical protein